MRTSFLLGGLLALVLALVAATALAAPSGEHASATAIAVIVRVPGQPDVTAGATSTPPSDTAALQGYVLGGAVQIATANSRVQTGPGAAPRASAQVDITGLSLFGGAVTVGKIASRSEAIASSEGTSGDFGGSSLQGLTVLGSPVTAGENARVELGPIGYAITLESAVQREDADGPGYRGFVSALHVYLTSEQAGLPAGSEIIVGYADASARGEPQPSAPPQEQVEPDGTETGETAEAGEAGGSEFSNEPAKEPEPAPPGAHGGPPPIVQNPPANVQPAITGGGFVFPVYGPVGFSDDFAAPRADTIWHHGNDIFAAQGAPVLAVTNGTLFLVGWNRLGGHRLWLRDDQGNEYYYAHLSAYSPLAVDGARVAPGDVLGFVGQSGASGGVSHLHFEVHPRALLGLGYDGALNPYTYLLAWQAQQDRDFSITLPVEKAPKPGAVLLDASDISTASGLDPDAVVRLFESPLVGGVEEADLLVPAPPGLIGARPGF